MSVNVFVCFGVAYGTVTFYSTALHCIIFGCEVWIIFQIVVDNIRMIIFIYSIFSIFEQNVFSNSVTKSIFEHFVRNLKNWSVRCLTRINAVHCPFILSHHVTLCVSVGFRQGKSIQVTGE